MQHVNASNLRLGTLAHGGSSVGPIFSVCVLVDAFCARVVRMRDGDVYTAELYAGTLTENETTCVLPDCRGNFCVGKFFFLLDRRGSKNKM